MARMLCAASALALSLLTAAGLPSRGDAPAGAAPAASAPGTQGAYGQDSGGQSSNGQGSSADSHGMRLTDPHPVPLPYSHTAPTDPPIPYADGRVIPLDTPENQVVLFRCDQDGSLLDCDQDGNLISPTAGRDWGEDGVYTGPLYDRDHTLVADRHVAPLTRITLSSTLSRTNPLYVIVLPRKLNRDSTTKHYVFSIYRGGILTFPVGRRAVFDKTLLCGPVGSLESTANTYPGIAEGDRREVTRLIELFPKQPTDQEPGGLNINPRFDGYEWKMFVWGIQDGHAGPPVSVTLVAPKTAEAH